MGKFLKYRNTPTHVDGIRFDSKREAKRYGELKLLQQGGAISALEVQPRYPLKAYSPDAEPVKVADYVGDFEYLEGNARVCEDVKSAATAKNPVYRLKIKMARAGYPHVEFREV